MKGTDHKPKVIQELINKNMDSVAQKIEVQQHKEGYRKQN